MSDGAPKEFVVVEPLNLPTLQLNIPCEDKEDLEEDNSVTTMISKDSIYSDKRGESSLTLVTGVASIPISKRLRLIPNPNLLSGSNHYKPIANDSSSFLDSCVTTDAGVAGANLSYEAAENALPLSAHRSGEEVNVDNIPGAIHTTNSHTSKKCGTSADSGRQVPLIVKKRKQRKEPPFVIPTSFGAMNIDSTRVTRSEIEKEGSVESKMGNGYPSFLGMDYLEEISFEDLEQLRELVDEGMAIMKRIGTATEFEAKVHRKSILLTNIFTEEHSKIVWIANKDFTFPPQGELKEIIDRAKKFRCWFKELTELFLENGYPTIVAEVIADTFTDGNQEDDMVSEILTKVDYSCNSSLCSMYDKLEGIEGVIEELEVACSEAFLIMMKVGDAKSLCLWLDNRIKRIPEIDDSIFYGVKKLADRLTRMLEGHTKIAKRSERILKDALKVLKWYSTIEKMFERHGYSTCSITQLNKAVEKQLWIDI